jgi:MFS-type transporter involved in bile tolerance (Atg22 family)
MRLVPPGRRGEDFGLYALVGKVSNGFGPLVLWSGTIALFSQVLDVTGRFGASRIAICVLACTALVGALILKSLPEAVEPDGIAEAA